MTQEQFNKWKEWYLAPAIDYRKVYGDPFVWTEQERQLMVMLKIKNNNGDNNGTSKLKRFASRKSIDIS